MGKKKQKLSRIITIRLFIAVFIAFIVSSTVTYGLLAYFALESAGRILYTAGSDIRVELMSKAQAPLINTTYDLLNKYINEGEEAAYNSIAGGNYTYYTHADGTIFISGNEEFIGKNVRDIEGVSDLMDVVLNEIAAGNVLFEGGMLSDISYNPVKTLDGKMDVYYVAATCVDYPDVFCVAAYTPEWYHQNLKIEGNVLAGNRRIGLTGQTVIIGDDHTVISSFGNAHVYEPFPNTELLDGYINGTDERAESYILPIAHSLDAYATEGVDIRCLADSGTFWGEECFFYMSDVGGAVYYICLYPFSEAFSQPNNTIIFIVLIEIIVFTVLFIVLHSLIKRKMVKKLDTVNASLSAITSGDLEEKVDVRDSREFNTLSDDINATVDKLKDYIAEAAARIDEDLAVAKAIQSSALPNVFPPFPERKEFELFASMNAAKEVGGDFYDFYMLGDHTLGFLIADVSGKSIPGAMFMMTSKTIIKSLAESGLPPAEVFSIANEKLCDGNEAEMFVTAWLGYLDLKTGLVRVANAGHNPPVLIRGGKAEYVVLKPGLMLAGMDGIRYKEQTLKLEKGDMLYLYTDGVTEAMDKDEEQYGEDRLIKLLSFGSNYPAPSAANGIVEPVCDMVTADVTKFTNGAEQSDDITMLCVRFLGGE